MASVNLTRRDLLQRMAFGSIGFSAASGLLRAAASDARRPNIVLLYADDLGWTDLACFGSGYYETPNLDRLCSQGMKFTNAYSCAANCSPSRASLLTGQYVPRHGVYTVGGKNRFDDDKKCLKWSERKLLAPENADGILPDKVTVAEALSQSGYSCGQFGKWHVGEGKGQLPTAQGFPSSVLMTSHSHFNFMTSPPPPKKPGKDDYLSDFLAEQAVGFVERNKGNPMFLYFPNFLVHSPHESKKDIIAKYKAKKPAGRHHNPVYAAMIECLDQSFGRVLDALDRFGLSENTLVMFFSDNGGVASADNRGLNEGGEVTSNHPLRGTKGMLYEGGIRVPLIARWPGVIEPGSVCDTPVIGVDFYPTFLEVTGAKPPAGQILDGESMIPLMKGAERLPREDIFWWMPGYLPGRQAPANAIRSGDYKLIEFFEDGHLELYNLKNDIGERNDLAAAEPDKARELHNKLKHWREATGAKIPERNPNFDPKNEGKW
ncbi:MAG TPA: sulfatase [Candidatus Brocadiia bacterium]|nr:sulfatase [Candidatus Brocadiia bacterium]